MAWWKISHQQQAPIPQNLLVVRGARHHADEIRSLLVREVPRPTADPEATLADPRIAAVTETCLKWDCFAELRPEPTNAFDKNAIEVLVEGKRVGYIAKNHARKVKTYLREGLRLECTIFWNGDPDDGFQFYTVQLFS
jgi:hypothetical protein